MNEAVKHYLDLCRSGRGEEAFFGLIDLVDDPTAELNSVFRAEIDPEVRWLIVHVIGERRQSNGLDLLEEAIRDTEPDVWKEALDGLVNLENPASAEVLTKRLGELGPSDQELREWIIEAILQLSDRIKNK